MRTSILSVKFERSFPIESANPIGSSNTLCSIKERQKTVKKKMKKDFEKKNYFGGEARKACFYSRNVNIELKKKNSSFENEMEVQENVKEKPVLFQLEALQSNCPIFHLHFLEPFSFS